MPAGRLVFLLRCRVVICLAALFPAPFLRVDTPEGPDAEVREFRLGELEARLKAMPSGPEWDYFAGILANRQGRNEESIHLLESVLPTIRTSHPERAFMALEALADDYAKCFRYADAARTYDHLINNFGSQMEAKKLQGTKDDAQVMHVLQGSPAQTISWQGSTRLNTERNMLASLNTELTVNGVQEKWLLDTGANLSVVSKSMSNRLGLKPLPGTAQTMAGLTGIENAMQLAILPTLEMGGATLHNVVLLILEDDSLNISNGKRRYQINGIIGYPVFQALGVITFTHDGWFEAGEVARRSLAGTRMYMKRLAPVLQCGVEGLDLPFTFDTGASGSTLSKRYLDKFHSAIGTWKKGENRSSGAGGIVKRKVYIQKRVTLSIGDEKVTLKDTAIFTEAMGTDLDEVYGNLGQDLVAGSESFTLDFSKMIFRLGKPLPSKEVH
jgi:predicted aspartyl protease